MYFNDIHIVYYIIFGILGLIVGQFIDWCSQRFSEHKKILSRELWTEYIRYLKPNYILMSITAILYLLLVYFVGIQTKGIIYNIELIKYAILIPLLLMAFIIDIRKKIIPNRLSLTIFEIGLIFTFIYGTFNINLAIDMLIGMIIGGGIFFLIALVGKLFSKKEAMGLGDVKLMVGLGLFFGGFNITVISILSFLIAAIVSIALLITRRKKATEYIAFAPFIVIASFVIIFAPVEVVMDVLLKIFSLGTYI